MKKYGFLLLTIACLASTLTLVFAAETRPTAPTAAPTAAPNVENAKPESMIQKTEEKIKDAAEKMVEKTEEIIEGKKPEPVKAGEEINLEKPVKADEITHAKADEKADEAEEADEADEADEVEEAEGTKGEAEEKTEEKADESPDGKTDGKADETPDENSDENSEMNSEENEEEKAEEKDAEDADDEENEDATQSEEEEITITEETMGIPETMTEDAVLRACLLHWLCHLSQHGHCWGPNCCFFGHSDASSPIRRENSIEEMLPNYCIGVLTSPVPDALAVHFGLRPGEGLWVEHVLPGSPAAEAGIHRGDILLQATIHSVEDGEKTKKVFWLNHPVLLMDLVEQIGPEEMELSAICSGKEQKINLKPTEKKELMEKAGLLK